MWFSSAETGHEEPLNLTMTTTQRRKEEVGCLAQDDTATPPPLLTLGFLNHQTCSTLFLLFGDIFVDGQMSRPNYQRCSTLFFFLILSLMARPDG